MSEQNDCLVHEWQDQCEELGDSDLRIEDYCGICGSRRKDVERIVALEAKLEAMVVAAQPFILMQFDEGIAGVDDYGHPLNEQGVARYRLRKALSAAQEEKKNE